MLGKIDYDAIDGPDPDREPEPFCAVSWRLARDCRSADGHFLSSSAALSCMSAASSDSLKPSCWTARMARSGSSSG